MIRSVYKITSPPLTLSLTCPASVPANERASATGVGPLRSEEGCYTIAHMREHDTQLPSRPPTNKTCVL